MKKYDELFFYIENMLYFCGVDQINNFDFLIYNKKTS